MWKLEQPKYFHITSPKGLTSLDSRVFWKVIVGKEEGIFVLFPHGPIRYHTRVHTRVIGDVLND